MNEAGMGKRTPLIYGLLAALWVLLLAWQVAEHNRLENNLRKGLVNRARDITTSLGLVMRSQRGFGPFISKSRLESALKELVKSEELLAVALVNNALEIVASADKGENLPTTELLAKEVVWEPNRVTFVNLVDLGASSTNSFEAPSATIISSGRPDTEDPQERKRRLERFVESMQRDIKRLEGEIVQLATMTNPIINTNRPPSRRRPSFGRPSWMDEAEYEAVREQQGVHGFVIQMTTLAMQSALRQDAWLRGIIIGLSLLAALAGGFAWRTVIQFTDFEVRLVRAREQNTHLKQMNLAAAGLAHETRNPLNLIRGRAQLIAREAGATDDMRGNCREITDEVDRVTAQLNEFINYSRPLEVRRTPLALGQVVDDVMRTLKPEMEDQGIELRWERDGLSVEADEKMFRQMLFNLLLNSVQALEGGGTIAITTGLDAKGAAWLEICDDGPGIPEEAREKIWQPYFTTRAGGTGLGLALVKQTVLAHGWDVTCRPNEPRGAVFRVGQMTPVSPT